MTGCWIRVSLKIDKNFKKYQMEKSNYQKRIKVLDEQRRRHKKRLLKIKQEKIKFDKAVDPILEQIK